MISTRSLLILALLAFIQSANADPNDDKPFVKDQIPEGKARLYLLYEKHANSYSFINGEQLPIASTPQVYHSLVVDPGEYKIEIFEREIFSEDKLHSKRVFTTEAGQYYYLYYDADVIDITYHQYGAVVIANTRVVLIDEEIALKALDDRMTAKEFEFMMEEHDPGDIQ